MYRSYDNGFRNRYLIYFLVFVFSCSNPFSYTLEEDMVWTGTNFRVYKEYYPNMRDTMYRVDMFYMDSSDFRYDRLTRYTKKDIKKSDSLTLLSINNSFFEHFRIGREDSLFRAYR